MILPINAADVRSVNEPHSPTSPGSDRMFAFGTSGVNGGGPSHEAVMIDSIKWRDLSFKSASIGCTVLVDRYVRTIRTVQKIFTSLISSNPITTVV